MADGSISFDATLDTKQLEREYNRVLRKIQQLKVDNSAKSSMVETLTKQAEELGVKLDQAKQNLYEMQNASPGKFSADDIASQAELVNSIQSQWDGVNNQIDRLNAGIEKNNSAIQANEGYAEGIRDSLESAGDAARDTSQGVEEIGRSADHSQTLVDKMGKKLVSLAKRVFIFSVITRALRSLRSWLSSVVMQNDQAREAVARLQGALLTLAQPIISVIIPAFTALVNVLTRVVVAIASVVSKLFGTTIKNSASAAKALNQQAKGYGGVGKAAKEASKSIMAFDELNTLNKEPEDSDGGGGGASSITPDFNFDKLGELTPAMQTLLDLALSIGAAIAGWQLGIALAPLLTGFLPNAISIAGGFAAIAAGVALLAIGIKDVIENGFNLKNTLEIIGGMLLLGLGISLLTGTWIPLLIAAIASVLLALTVASGHGQELIDGVKETLSGFIDYFVGIFTGNIEKTVEGIKKICDGLKKVVLAVISGIQYAINFALNWLDEQTNGKLHGIIESIKTTINNQFESFKKLLSDVLDVVKQVFTGITQFVSGVFTGNWSQAWEGIKNIVKGAVNGVISLVNTMIRTIVDGINSIGNFLSFIPGLQGFHITAPQIPMLAQGAVIPPNKEFLAVLGDQKSGNNIEAPENLIRQIVREESGNGNSNELLFAMQEQITVLRQILDRTGVYLDGAELAEGIAPHLRTVNMERGW